LQDLTDRRFADLRHIKMLVLDEADRMLDMGFLPAIRRILALLPKTRQTLCFSATLEASVAGLVHEYMRDPVRVALGSVLKPAESVELKAYEVRPGEKLDVLRQLLYAEKGQTLIFTRTKRGAQRLAQELARDGFTATMIHGDRSQSQRNGALSGFQEGRFQVLVATDIASRGLHCDDVAHVINYDLPKWPKTSSTASAAPDAPDYPAALLLGRRRRSRRTPQHRAHPEAAHRTHANGPLRRTPAQASHPEHAGVPHTNEVARRSFRLKGFD
jgi:ATP-dependent RNA helicase RhlE